MGEAPHTASGNAIGDRGVEALVEFRKVPNVKSLKLNLENNKFSPGVAFLALSYLHWACPKISIELNFIELSGKTALLRAS